MNTDLKEYTKRYFLTPAECNPEQQLPISGLVAKIIEVATEHANMWGVGYASLIESNEAWVLSRVTVEMKRYPRVNEYYSLSTWIEGYNRHFSDRNFAILDSDGNEIGYARTVWVVINSVTRESADISKFSYIVNNISERECPIEKQSRMKSINPTRTSIYKFQYSDTDFNRHVNTCRYIELLMNQWSLDYFDNHRLERFEIAFIRETKCDDTVEIILAEEGGDCRADIVYDGDVHCRARLVFSEENYLS